LQNPRKRKSNTGKGLGARTALVGIQPVSKKTDMYLSKGPTSRGRGGCLGEI